MDERLRDAVPVLARLEEAGYTARFVGGCVRDAVLGRPLHDVDIATSAKPEQVMALFPRHVPTGLKHGTVTVIMDGRHYEVTTFRQESAYEKHRRPLEVAFIDDLHGDLLRRDYTMNALAMDRHGVVTDPFGGLNDIGRRVVRCVGDPDARLQEDALRMLRGIRFAAEFGFRISHSTWRAIRRHRSLLRHIAMERVGAELDKMLTGADPDRAIALLMRSGLLAETAVPLTGGTAASVCGRKMRLAQLPADDSRWTALWMAGAVLPEEARRRMDRFAFGSRRLRDIFAAVQLHCAVEAEPEAPDRRKWTSFVLQYGRAAAGRWLMIVRALPDLLPHPDCCVDAFAAWTSEMPIDSVKELAIGGAELANAAGGRKRGPWIRETLESLLLAVAAGDVPNERGALLAEAKRLIGEAAKEERHP